MTATRPAPALRASKTSKMSELTIDVLVEDEAWTALVSDAASLVAQVLSHAAEAEAVCGVVTVLLADDAAVQGLNARFRGQDKPTNVLSFPGPDLGAGAAGAVFWGDIALASGVLAREAEAGAKPASAHLAHLVLHGFLHLLGYDHETEAQAAAMETLETKLLAEMGYPDPY